MVADETQAAYGWTGTVKFIGTRGGILMAIRLSEVHFQAPWNIRKILANGGPDAQRLLFQGQQHPRHADSRQQAIGDVKKDLPPVSNGVFKETGYSSPTLDMNQLEDRLGLSNQVI